MFLTIYGVEKSQCDRSNINLFNDYTASIYVNGKCKHKHIRPFLNF